MKKIVLVGNPNVGKSCLFSRLTGVEVLCSNYPGTTVSYCSGSMPFEGGRAELLDVPGLYSLKPKSDAERTARDMLKQADLVVNVVDATNLERNLYLTLELLEFGKPMVIALNMWDDARHVGITIDPVKLERMLGVPVVPTVGATGEGVRKLARRLSEAKSSKTKKQSDEDRWASAAFIAGNVQHVRPRSHTLLERLSDASIRPLTGIPLAVAALAVVFTLIVSFGNWVVENILDPLFKNLYLPLAVKATESVFPSGVIHDLLLGVSYDPQTSMGLLTTGIYVEFNMVLPFVILFYATLSLLEDIGYLPRLATLLDSVMHKIGLHGYGVIPMVLGLGCNVPGIMATRVLESRKQRFIAATLMSICVPCLAKNAVIIGLLLRYGVKYLMMVYATLAIVYVVVGFALNKTVRGESPELLVEIPPYRRPSLAPLLKKTWVRVRYFLVDATPFVLFGVLIVNVLYLTGAASIIAALFKPLVSRWLGLPEDAVLALLLGFLRKDIAVGMLAPLGLTPEQLVVACTVLSMYFPCIATFAVLLRELGPKDLLKSIIVMIMLAFTVGGILRVLLL